MPTPTFGAFSDDFDSGISPGWDVVDGTAPSGTGTAVMDTVADGVSRLAAPLEDMTGKWITLKVLSVDTAAGDGIQYGFSLRDAAGDWVEFLIYQGELRVRVGYSTLHSAALPGAPIWLGIEHQSAGAVGLYTSTDGVTWTLFHTVAAASHSVDPTSAQGTAWIVESNASKVATWELDDYNVLPPVGPTSTFQAKVGGTVVAAEPQGVWVDDVLRPILRWETYTGLSAGTELTTEAGDTLTTETGDPITT